MVTTAIFSFESGSHNVILLQTQQSQLTLNFKVPFYTFHVIFPPRPWILPVCQCEFNCNHKDICMFSPLNFCATPTRTWATPQVHGGKEKSKLEKQTGKKNCQHWQGFISEDFRKKSTSNKSINRKTNHNIVALNMFFK